MHPWHDIYIDEKVIETAVPVIIEVPTGSKNKYELDKESGLLKLDRVLYSAVHYPANYGFVPRSFCDDGDPLDALVLTMDPLHPLTLVEARAIGVMRMRDDKGIDDKIIAVARETVMSERAQNLAAETGALVYWQDAEAVKDQIARDIETLGAIEAMLSQ